MYRQPTAGGSFSPDAGRPAHVFSLVLFLSFCFGVVKYPTIEKLRIRELPFRFVDRSVERRWIGGTRSFRSTKWACLLEPLTVPFFIGSPGWICLSRRLGKLDGSLLVEASFSLVEKNLGIP